MRGGRSDVSFQDWGLEVAEGHRDHRWIRHCKPMPVLSSEFLVSGEDTQQKVLTYIFLPHFIISFCLFVFLLGSSSCGWEGCQLDDLGSQ